jgi:hypothetical protein
MAQLLLKFQKSIELVPSFKDKICCCSCKSAYTVTRHCLGKLEFV